MSQMKEATPAMQPRSCRRPGLGPDLRGSPAASEQLRTSFLLCSSASNSPGHSLGKSAYSWFPVPRWDGTGEAAKVNRILRQF